MMQSAFMARLRWRWYKVRSWFRRKPTKEEEAAMEAIVRARLKQVRKGGKRLESVSWTPYYPPSRRPK